MYHPKLGNRRQLLGINGHFRILKKKKVRTFKVEKIKELYFPTFLGFDLAWFGFVVVFLI